MENIETLGDIIGNYDQIVAEMGHGIISNNANFNEKLNGIVNSLLGEISNNV